MSLETGALPAFPAETSGTQPGPADNSPHPQKVGYLQLTFLIYGAACGGAFGLESIIGQAGPGFAMLLLVLVPFLHSVPLSLAVAELTAMMPFEGGNYRWSREAFGDFLGYQAGWWSWLGGVVVSASYAALFAKYLDTWVPAPQTSEFLRWQGWGLVSIDPSKGAAGLSWGAHWAACLALIWLVHLLNVRGIDLVGDSAVVLSILLLLPFAIMTAWGATHYHYSAIVPFTAPGKNYLDYGVALAAAFWLYSGYDKLSSAAEEVDNPQRTFPPALLTAAGLATITCVLPTQCALGCLGNWQDWTDGYFPLACLKMLGPWLENWMVVGGLISNALLLIVTMLSASRVLQAMAEDGFVSHRLAYSHPRFGTPVGTLLTGSVVLSLLTVFSFTQLLIIYVWLQMFTNLQIFVNAWSMRRSHPDMPRPYSVPGGRLGIVLLALPTVFLACICMGSAVVPDGKLSYPQLVIAILATLSGPVAYALRPRVLNTAEPAPGATP